MSEATSDIAKGSSWHLEQAEVILEPTGQSKVVSEDCEHCETFNHRPRTFNLGEIRASVTRNCIKCTVIRDAVAYRDADLDDNSEIFTLTSRPQKFMLLQYVTKDGMRNLSLDYPPGSLT